ncbi:MAG: pre-peptidase C-terminal domain-containing protein [Anaerolineae bacterium]|nr:pre-peptidase C-terminal domain-containing protein [Anaerolineae bacterium]
MIGTTRGPKHVIRFVFALMLLLPIAGVQSALASPLSQAGVIPITYGDTLTGSLNAKTPEAQYQFSAAAGDLVSISVVATSGDLDPKVQLLDLSGAVLAENDDIEFPSNTDSLIENFSIPATGDYRIVVMRGLDSTSGGYQVSLMRGGAGDTPPLPTLGTETGTGALRFVLSWSGAADLDLVVTDPAGNQIYWDAPTSPTGGALDSSQGNDFCEVAAAQPPGGHCVDGERTSRRLHRHGATLARV